MPRAFNPLASTAAILEELKKHTGGIRANDMTTLMGRSMQAPLSRLYAYGVIDRTQCTDKRQNVRNEYLYRTKLPRVGAPPAASEPQESEAQMVLL